MVPSWAQWEQEEAGVEASDNLGLPNATPGLACDLGRHQRFEAAAEAPVAAVATSEADRLVGVAERCRWPKGLLATRHEQVAKLRLQCVAKTL